MFLKSEDIQYKINREYLIPFAEAFANAKISKYKRVIDGVRQPSKEQIWNRHFHLEMDRLCAETGIIKPKPSHDKS